jgi:hypothetical protein
MILYKIKPTSTWRANYDLTQITSLSLVMNIISDYFALFLIRWVLLISSRRPVVSLLVGTGMACFLVSIFIEARFRFLELMWGTPVNRRDMFGVLTEPDSGQIFIAVPAFIVFAWLPLFAFGLLLLRLSKPLAQTIEKAKWFLKDGKDHPLEAIGFVAGVIVFIIVTVWQFSFGNVALDKAPAVHEQPEASVERGVYGAGVTPSRNP